MASFECIPCLEFAGVYGQTLFATEHNQKPSGIGDLYRMRKGFSSGLSLRKPCAHAAPTSVSDRQSASIRAQLVVLYRKGDNSGVEVFVQFAMEEVHNSVPIHIGRGCNDESELDTLKTLDTYVTQTPSTSVALLVVPAHAMGRALQSCHTL